jgi:predicted DNA-binding transcriptional regulator AlpA
MSDAHAPEPLYSWNQIRPLIGNMGRSTWERAMRRGEAPKPIRISPNRMAWTASSIADWQSKRGVG